MCSQNLGPGWNISPQGLNLISENNTITDKNTLVKRALNADLKEVGQPVLTKELNKPRISELVLQIQKIRNVSAPKANEDSEAAPRMLKLILTDGESYAQAIEASTIPEISRERTAPGSKLLLINVRILNGFLILNKDNTRLLGGRVDHLIEKWELAKSVQHCSRPTVSSDAAPAWVNFGCKISESGEELRRVDNHNRDQTKENSEFETLRQGAIAEAATGAVRKVFGGGVKLSAPNSYRNDNKGRNEGSKGYNKSKKELKSGREKEIDDRPQKPSDKVSLFDFLEDKLNITEVSNVAKHNDELKPNNFIKPAFDNKKNSYNNNSDKGYSNQRINPKKEYNHHLEKKYNNSKDSAAGRDFPTNRREPYRNQGYSNKYDTQRDFQFDRDSTKTRRETNRGDINFPPFEKQVGRIESYQPPQQTNPRMNRVNDNSNKYNTPRESMLKKDPSININININMTRRETNRDQNRERSKDQIRETNRDPNNVFENKIENQPNLQSNPNKFSRNDKERINDSWHYRAPSKEDNLVNTNSHVENLADSLSKVSVNSEFASRSLRQHLNLDLKKPPSTMQNNSQTDDLKKWGIGDECLAKYWEDEKFYPAKITASTDTTYVVQFKGYGNVEEVLKADCRPFKGQERGDEKRQYKGTLEFRRNPRKFAS